MNEREDEGEEGYSWERDYARTWEEATGAVAAPLPGVVVAAEEDDAVRNNRRFNRRPRFQCDDDASAVRRGVHRTLEVIVDMSRAMAERDLRPSRLGAVLASVDAFVRAWRDESPVSLLGIAATRNSEAAQVSSVGLASAARHMELLRAAAVASPPAGDASLQNALTVALDALRAAAPRHSTREVLIVLGALTTCDPGDVHTTIAECRAAGVRCSIVALAAELGLCATIARETGGTSRVALSEQHLTTLLLDHLRPPPVSADVPAQLVRMGFPRRVHASAAFCVCHNEARDEGFECPQCGARVCELPATCAVCGLSLLSSAHLARSYHHLFPVPAFCDVPSSVVSSIRGTECAGCGEVLTQDTTTAGKCPSCNSVFCDSCDEFIHNVLHNCPSCCSKQSKPG